MYGTGRFGHNPSVIGKKITLNQIPVTIIGVNPAYFTGIEPGTNFEIWAPLNLQPRISASTPFKVVQYFRSTDESVEALKTVPHPV